MEGSLCGLKVGDFFVLWLKEHAYLEVHGKSYSDHADRFFLWSKGTSNYSDGSGVGFWNGAGPSSMPPTE